MTDPARQKYFSLTEHKTNCKCCCMLAVTQREKIMRQNMKTNRWKSENLEPLSWVWNMLIRHVLTLVVRTSNCMRAPYVIYYICAIYQLNCKYVYWSFNVFMNTRCRMLYKILPTWSLGKSACCLSLLSPGLWFHNDTVWLRNWLGSRRDHQTSYLI